jgi:ABC-type Mn2+/Zn2+ transport system ATPase subunit
MHGKSGAAVSEGLADVYSERSRAIIDKCHVSKIAWRRANAQGTQTAITHLRVYGANARGKQTALTHVWVYVKTYRTSIQIKKKEEKNNKNTKYVPTHRNLDFQTAYLGQTAYIA